MSRKTWIALVCLSSMVVACGGGSGGGGNRIPPPTGLAYPTNALWLNVGAEMGSLSPQVSGVVTNYSVSPYRFKHQFRPAAHGESATARNCRNGRISGFNRDRTGLSLRLSHGRYGQLGGSSSRTAAISGSVSGAIFTGTLDERAISGTFSSAGPAITASGGGSSSIQTKLTTRRCILN